jgi:DNA replication initiation complex subunit (GINS family)
MKTIETETTTTLEAQAAPGTETKEQKAPTKAKGAKQARRVAPAKAKSAKKTTPAKKPAKAPKKAAKAKADGPREGSKTAQVVAMLQRKNGATLTEIMESMGWLRHTVRGFMAGAMKKAGYTVESFKSDKGDRTYRINQ